MTNIINRSPAAQALIDCAKMIEAKHNSIKEALQKIHDHPNCRYEVEAQFGKEIWDSLKK